MIVANNLTDILTAMVHEEKVVYPISFLHFLAGQTVAS